MFFSSSPATLLPLFLLCTTSWSVSVPPNPTPPSSSSDMVLQPPNSAHLEAALVLIQAPQMPPTSYLPLARAVQNVSDKISLWVGIPDLMSVGSPTKLNISAVAERIIAEMTGKGMKKDTPLFFGAHSQEYASLLQDYVPTTRAVGMVLLGAYLKRSHRDLKSPYPIATLTVGGELDGVCRITRIMEEYFHRIHMAESRKVATLNFPVGVVSGMTHLQFAHGEPSDAIKRYDLKPEIDDDTAHLNVARLVTSFIGASLDATDKNAVTILESAVYNASQFLHPLIEAYLQEGSYLFKPPCYNNPPSATCQAGSAWTEIAMNEMAELKVVRVNDTDSFHPASQVFPRYYHPEILGQCTKPDSTCVVSLSSVSENIYYKDKSDSGLVPNSACEVRAKLKSRQSVMLAAGFKNVSFNESDAGSRCKKINQLAYNWALNQSGEVTRNRFSKFGVPIYLGEDAGSFGNGGLWIYLPMEYKQTQSSAGKEILQIRAVQLKTDVDYSIGIFAGMHYCKLLSPARVMEWVYVDGLRSHYSLSQNRAELKSCGL